MLPCVYFRITVAAVPGRLSEATLIRLFRRFADLCEPVGCALPGLMAGSKRRPMELISTTQRTI
jgi:hypothetical protein